MDRHAQKKEQILQFGMEVMLQRGYNGTGVKDIVDAAGIPKGSFYNYFHSKEAFVLEALDIVYDKIRQDAEMILQDDPASPLECLEKFFTDSADKFLKNNHRFGCFLGKICQEMADVNESIRVKTDDLFMRLRHLFGSCLIRAQQLGQLDSKRNLDQLAEFMLVAWEGAQMRSKCSRDDFPLKAFLNELNRLLYP